MADTPQPEQGHQEAESWQSLEKAILDHRNTILGGLAVVLLVIGGLVGYKQLYLKPREGQAQTRIVEAQQAFAVDSFRLALNGNTFQDGFASIAKKYGGTPTGKLAHGYAALCELQLGNFAGTLDHGKKFASDDPLVSARVLGAMGHAHSEQGDFTKAEQYYERAAKASDNVLLAPIHFQLAGMAAMERNDFAAAKRHFQVIKDRFPQSQEGRSVDKFLALASAKAG
jgi:tetratricopeptide (TPR) repeat protein